MSAKDMFEKLGYSLKVEHNDFIEYSKEDCGHIDFYFLIETKRFYSRYCFSPSFQSTAHSITLDEFEAVQKQMEELGWFEEEQKEETNFEHYFECLSKRKMMDFALVDGRVVQCLGTHCVECDFNGDCIERKFKWLKQPYEKPKYELSQFEFDLVKTFDRCKECCLLNGIECLKKLIEKGYFKGIDPFTKVHDIIDNCEVIQ